MATDDTQQHILDKSLELATQSSWEQLHLFDVAAALNLSLDQIRVHFSQKDDLVEAWYDRADVAMLKAAGGKTFLKLDIPQRLHKLIMAWLDALAKHKTISRDMLLYKFEPGHIHLQVLGTLRVSRTVQWLREAAHQDSTSLRRILEEIGLSSIYLLTFACWMNDTSEKQERTRAFLKRRLKRAEHVMNLVDDWLPMHSRQSAGSNADSPN